MRGLVRRRTQEDEEESVFVTMTDMTISFLLIVMILLAFFATQLSSQDTVPRDQFNVILNNLREARADIRRLEAEREAAITERDAARQSLDSAISERDSAIEERDRLRSENAALLDRIRELEALVERLQADLAAVTAERDELLERLSRLQQINPLEAYLAQAIEQRREILIELRNRLRVQFPELEGVISIQQDTLRFQGEGLFRENSSQLETVRKRAIVETMGRVLDEILVCYTLTDTPIDVSACNNTSILVEAIQIEGHTDSRGSDEVNFPLSAARAITTLQTMVRAAPSLQTRLNWSRQPVMSIAGYGPMRPISLNDTDAGRSANRRIDLRIIMYVPSNVEEVDKIRRRLDALRAAGGAE